MDINELLELFTSPDFSIETLTADDLQAHRDALTKYQAGLVKGLSDGTVDADDYTKEAVAALKDAVDAVEAEVGRRDEARKEMLAALGADPAAESDSEGDGPADTVDDATVDEPGEPAEADAPVAVAASRKPARLPTLPASPPLESRTPAATTSDATPKIQFFASSVKVTPDAAPLTDAALRERWSQASGAGGGGVIGYSRTTAAHAVRYEDYKHLDNQGEMWDAAYAKWRDSRPSRLVAAQANIPDRAVVSAAACIAPARVVTDVPLPCPYGPALVDDFPTVQSREILEVTPRTRVDYSVMPTDGVGVRTEGQVAASDPEKTCVQLCPPEPVGCRPKAFYWCAEEDPLTATFWPSAAAASEATLIQFTRALRDYDLLEQLVDPTGSNPLIHKYDPITVSDWGVSLDMLQWMEQLRELIKACSGCDLDMIMVPEFVLRHGVIDHQVRNGTNLRDAASEVMAAWGAEDGVTIRTYSHAPAVWPTSGGPAELTDGSRLSPICVSDGTPIGDTTPASALIIAGRSDAVTLVEHAEVQYRVDKPAANRREFLAETISTACVHSDLYQVEVPVCVKGGSGALVSVTCP